MAKTRYEHGLEEVGDGLWAWLQPDGSWGYSNAGLITDGDESLLVDTLFDLRLTREMLDAMKDASGAAANIDVVVNTHANGDHCWGNQLVRDAEIISSKASADEMGELAPSLVAKLVKAAKVANKLGPIGRGALRLGGALGAKQLGAVGRGAPFVEYAFGAFDFDGIELVPPTRTFDGELELKVGDRRVRLVEVGPAHTKGDVLVELPDDGVVYTGDILFIDAHPIIWEGPVKNWIDACERIVAMKPDVVVPGHGPLTDVAGVRRVRDYLTLLYDETKARFDSGMPLHDTVRDVRLEGFGDYSEAERLAVNVDTIYRELGGGIAPDAVELFARMAELRAET